MSNLTKSISKEKIPFLSSAVIQFSHVTVFMILMPLVPQLMEAFPIAPSQFTIVVTALFFLFGANRMVPSTAMVTSSVKPQNRGSLMSFNSAIRQMTNGVAALLAGLIINIGDDGLYHNYDLVGYFTIAMGFFAIFISRKIKVVDDESFTN